MPKVNVIRAQVSPITEVEMTLSVDEAIDLAALLGQFGSEYDTELIYRELTDKMNIITSGSDPLSKQLYKKSLEARRAISTRHAIPPLFGGHR